MPSKRDHSAQRAYLQLHRIAPIWLQYSLLTSTQKPATVLISQLKGHSENATRTKLIFIGPKALNITVVFQNFRPKRIFGEKLWWKNSWKLAKEELLNF